jgi:tripartite-type tricarboxylate transporter receptor subunit TctC
LERFRNLGRQAAVGLGLLLGLAAPAAAQDRYPVKPIHVTVSYGPGGAIDVAARIVAEHMARNLGQPLVVENKPGAGSSIAAEAVARAAPDGYSLLVTGTAHPLIPVLYPQATVDPIRDFAPISHLGNMPFVLAVHPALPATDVAGLLAYVKANPGKLSVGSAGPGSSSDLADLLLAKLGGLDFVRVPYRSTPAAMNALVAGEVDFMLDSQNVLAPQVRGGALRGLAVSSLERSRLLPALPTLDEAGLAGFEASSWQVMLAPAGTPPAIVERLAAAVAAALADPTLQQRYDDLGYQLPTRIGPAALTTFLARETAKWAPLARQSGAPGG